MTAEIHEAALREIAEGGSWWAELVAMAIEKTRAGRADEAEEILLSLVSLDDEEEEPVNDDLPPDAHELLSPEAIAHWQSGARFAEGFYDEEVEESLARREEWFDYLREERGFSEVEVACAVARVARTMHAEYLGLVERVTLPDGSAVFYEKDPFEHLPTLPEEDL